MGLTTGYKKADGQQNLDKKGGKLPTGGYKGGHSDPIVPGGRTATGLRKAHSPSSEAGAVAHVKTHVC
jgi:hypothetical protein